MIPRKHDIIELIQKYRETTGDTPAYAQVSPRYIKMITHAPEELVKDETVTVKKGALMEFLGVPIYQSAMLPQQVLCALFTKEHKCCAIIVDET